MTISRMVHSFADVIIDLVNLDTVGEWPRGLREEVLNWVSAYRKELMEEWQKWHP